MKSALTFCLVIVGLINFAPVIGIISAQKLESAYSISLAGSDLEILMRHRALLFGVLGAFILYASFNPVYQTAAMVMAGVSMLGFAVLTIAVGGYNEAVAKVLFTDFVGLFFLSAAAVLKYFVVSAN